MEKLLERNITLNTETEYLLTVFEGALGLMRVRQRQRDGLDPFIWSLSAKIGGARENLAKGEDGAVNALNWTRQCLEPVVEAVRYLSFYSATHANELWETLRLGLTFKLPVVDSLSALED